MKQTNKKLRDVQTPLLNKALAFATEAHAGQLENGTSNHYNYHLQNVADILVNQGATESLLTACLLKDVWRDTNISIDTIKDVFGMKIALIVREVAIDRPVSEISHEGWMIKIATAIVSVRELSSSRLSHEYKEETMNKAYSVLNTCTPLIDAWLSVQDEEDLSMTDLLEILTQELNNIKVGV